MIIFCIFLNIQLRLIQCKGYVRFQSLISIVDARGCSVFQRKLFVVNFTKKDVIIPSSLSSIGVEIRGVKKKKEFFDSQYVQGWAKVSVQLPNSS